MMGDNLMLMRVTPTQVLRDWLLNNTDTLRMSPERDIILMARVELGSQISELLQRHSAGGCADRNPSSL